MSVRAVQCCRVVLFSRSVVAELLWQLSFICADINEVKAAFSGETGGVFSSQCL